MCSLRLLLLATNRWHIWLPKITQCAKPAHMHVLCQGITPFSAVGLSKVTGIPENIVTLPVPHAARTQARAATQHRRPARLLQGLALYKVEQVSPRFLRVFTQYCTVRIGLGSLFSIDSSDCSEVSCCGPLEVLTVLLRLLVDVTVQYPDALHVFEDSNFFMTPTGIIYVDVPAHVAVFSQRKGMHVMTNSDLRAHFTNTSLSATLSALITQLLTAFIRTFYMQKYKLAQSGALNVQREKEDISALNEVLQYFPTAQLNGSITLPNVIDYLHSQIAQRAMERFEVSRGIERDPILKTTQLHRSIKERNLLEAELYSRLYMGCADLAGQTALHYLVSLSFVDVTDLCIQLLPYEVSVVDRTSAYAGSYFLQARNYELASILSLFEPTVDKGGESFLMLLVHELVELNNEKVVAESQDCPLTQTKPFAPLVQAKMFQHLIGHLSHHMRLQSNSGHTALIIATQGNMYELTALLVGAESGIPSHDSYGYTLAVAMYHGLPDMVRLLLPYEKYVLLTAGFTANMIYVALDDANVVESLRREDFRKQTPQGWTALMFAAVAGNIKAVQRLAHVEAGLVNADGQTAGTLAFIRGNFTVSNLLSKFEIVCDGIGDTLLHRACRSYLKTPTNETLATVRLYNSMAGEYTADGDLAISLAIKGSNAALVNVLDLEYRSRLKTVKYTKGTSTKYFYGATPMMLAALRGFADIPPMLISASAGMQDDEGFTALMCAARSGCVDLVKKLLPYEARMQTKQGFTSLMCASQEGHLEIVRLLLDEGREAAIQDRNGNTALFRAICNDNVQCAGLLLPAEHSLCNNSDVSMLMVAAEHIVSDSMVNMLLNPKYKQLRRQQSNGKTALMCAAASNNLPVVRAILEAHQRNETRMQDEDGFTALMHAATLGHIEICTLLAPKEGGMVSTMGQTAAMIAADMEYLDCLKVIYPFEPEERFRRLLELTSENGPISASQMN